ncbi:MAG: ATP-binding protein [Stenotrophomonas sp.]|nr:ATP-binding protein [Stenotrophomonas sp.]
MAQGKQSESSRSTGLQVLFGQRSALSQGIPENTVLIVPSMDAWNDFGLHTRIDYLFRVQESDPVSTSGYIGFLDKDGASSGNRRLATIVEESGRAMVPATARHRFFTMLPDMEAYRVLVREFGAVDASSALSAANDLVALNEFSPKSDLLENATRTEIFTRSFMRNSETFFAFKNAGPILHGLSEERKGVLSQSLAIRFQMAGRENEHDLAFDFDHEGVLPKRIAVIIGKNGVGKSQTLGRIARAALDGSDNLTDGTESGRPLINRLLAFAPTNEAESVFPAERKKRPRIWYQRYSLNRSRRSRRNDYVSDLIVQVARSPETIGDILRWEIFTEALSTISEHEQLHLVTNAAKDSPVPAQTYVSLKDLQRGQEQRKLDRFASIDVKKEPVRVVAGEGFPLSSGEISFLKFAAQASLAIENGSLLLLDEPETHLHPNFISRFVSLLDKLLELTGSAAIIATHSVYFVREVFREQVTVLGIDGDGFVHADQPLLRTFGADVGAISYFVFGEDEPSRLAAEVEHRLLSRHASWDEVYQTYKDEISLEMLNGLRAAFENRSES